MQGNDCKLIPVSSLRQLPNFLPNFVNGYYDMDALDGCRNYIVDICDSPSGRGAAINTGMGSLHFGTMSPSPSFLVYDGMVHEIWTTYLNTDNTNLQPGDSGSWVFDVEDSSDPAVIGQAIACSRGRAHVSLLKTEFEEIPIASKANRPDQRLEYLIRDALSVEVLSRFKNDIFALSLRDLVQETALHVDGHQAEHGVRNIAELLADCGTEILQLLNIAEKLPNLTMASWPRTVRSSSTKVALFSRLASIYHHYDNGLQREYNEKPLIAPTSGTGEVERMGTESIVIEPDTGNGEETSASAPIPSPNLWRTHVSLRPKDERPSILWLIPVPYIIIS
ncbi:hypothetical protein B0H63DRAFT_186365 [Podospora didyma]|uniref:Uncharacterized protein n=1 Tax=Podospora didyma TaxID=330526 RepID=A0AAE0NQ90_9PEZI|nr:hypothetical protein B0H63DRAFT_186365 [Podospora didyma]